MILEDHIENIEKSSTYTIKSVLHLSSVTGFKIFEDVITLTPHDHILINIV